MMKKKLNKTIALCIFCSIYFSVSLFNVCKSDVELSLSERRVLASAPTLSVKNMLSTQYMKQFETYAMDQFICRDMYRSLKSFFHLYILNVSDTNSLYYEEGHINSILYPYNETSIQYALTHFNAIYDMYLKDSEVNIYNSIVYDKNYHMNNILTIDYETMKEDIKEGMSFATYIEINDLLSLDDFYTSDSHWKQEELIPIVKHLLTSMNQMYESEYESKTYQNVFEGVYYGQLGLPLSKDDITYLYNDAIINSVVENVEDECSEVYDIEKLTSNDPYELYLSGATPYLTIYNEQALSNKELIVFRDSYASSLIPLMIENYASITLIDTRYMSVQQLGEYITFDNQDVLFLYSSLVLNSSFTFK